MNPTSIRNKYEQKFQDRLIAEIKGLGGSAIHIEPVGRSGFPDLLVTSGDRYRLVELKSVENAHRQKFHSIFEDGQLGWHASWDMAGNRPVITVIEVRAKRACLVSETIATTCLECFDWTLAEIAENVTNCSCANVAWVILELVK
jgi:hypothetical protein